MTTDAEPTTTYDIELTPGDGIGPEVVDAALPIFRAVADDNGFELDITRRDWRTEDYVYHGEMMPEDGLPGLFEAVVDDLRSRL